MLFAETAKEAFQKMRAGYELSGAEMKVAFPCLSAILVPAEKVKYNDYNPNAVAPPETSIIRVRS